jgi:hypothetical protein
LGGAGYESEPWVRSQEQVLISKLSPHHKHLARDWTVEGHHIELGNHDHGVGWPQSRTREVFIEQDVFQHIN